MNRNLIFTIIIVICNSSSLSHYHQHDVCSTVNWIMTHTSIAWAPSSPSSVVATTTTSTPTPVIGCARDTKRLSIHLPFLLPVWPTTSAEIRNIQCLVAKSSTVCLLVNFLCFITFNITLLCDQDQELHITKSIYQSGAVWLTSLVGFAFTAASICTLFCHTLFFYLGLGLAKGSFQLKSNRGVFFHSFWKFI